MKPLDSLPPRILRFRLHLARYNYNIIHVPGKLLYTADTLSRAPSSSYVNDIRLQEETEAFMDLCIDYLPASKERLKEYQIGQQEDPICSSVIEHCRNGWPNDKNKIEASLHPYWKARGELTIGSDNLLLHGKRIVVPKALRRQTLEKIHTGHQGIQRCRLLAKISVWWPGISHEIENMVKQCRKCARDISPHKEPMIVSQLPDYPWQRVGSDFSRYPEVIKLTNTSSRDVITALKTVFAQHGVPETVISDNGPQYTSQEFSVFSEEYNFKHVTSSPHYPQSNGQAERTVQTIKKLLKESKDQQLALLTYRTTPFPWCDLSPAELLMGRRLRSIIPQAKEQLVPDWKFLKDFKEQNQTFKDKQKRNYDKRHGVLSYPLIANDTAVWITTDAQPIPGRVMSSSTEPRSYVVETPTGQFRRNNITLILCQVQVLQNVPTPILHLMSS